MTPSRLQLVALPGIPLVKPGDDLAGLVLTAVAAAGERLATGDVLVLAQKVFSKAEGRYADLNAIDPSPQARDLAAKADKDPRMVELILSESSDVLRHRPGVIVVAHRLGFVMANAGIDASNVEPIAGEERVLLLPDDPDRSCAALRDRLHAETDAEVAVVMNDSVGRAWRQGIVGIALGAAGLPSLLDLNGRVDLFDRPLMATQVGLADEIASAASLLQGQADEGHPAVLLRGLEIAAGNAGASSLIRPETEDLFR